MHWKNRRQYRPWLKSHLAEARLAVLVAQSFGSPQISAMGATKADDSPINVLLNSARKARRKSLLLRASPNKEQDQLMFEKVKKNTCTFTL